MTAWAAFRERQSRSAREIQIEAIRFASPGMAAAFDITLTNRSGESIRVDKIYIASPTGCQIAYRWRVPIIVINSYSAPVPDWDLSEIKRPDFQLSPSEREHFEIGLPNGFSIYESRSSRVVVVFEYTTSSWSEKRHKRYFVRSISPP
jgi:hypothetical protein